MCWLYDIETAVVAKTIPVENVVVKNASVTNVVIHESAAADSRHDLSPNLANDDDVARRAIKLIDLEMLVGNLYAAKEIAK